jgi:hypothetical protein
MYSSFLEEGMVFDQRRVETSCSVRRTLHDVLEVVMDGHLVPASSNSKIRDSLENFTLDAERWLAAFYWCVRTSYGDDAAHAAADCWLRVFEERLEGSSELPELTRITAAAIALFVSRLVLIGRP